MSYLRTLQNAAIHVSSWSILISTHRHDYRSSTASGRYFAIDGGLDYCRWVGDDLGWFQLSLTSNDDESKIDACAVWLFPQGETTVPMLLTHAPTPDLAALASKICNPDYAWLKASAERIIEKRNLV